MAETFQTITSTVRERQKIEALNAQGTMRAIITTLVPVLLLVIFLLISLDYVMPLFTQTLGWFALAIILGLQIIGLVVMKKIVTI